MSAVVLSLDADLGQGPRDSEAVSDHHSTATRESWHRLLALFDDYDVPATWGVVGQLLADPDAERPALTGRTDRDATCRDAGRDGTDLVDAVEDADADHEIALRTFSNVDMSVVSRDTAVDEIRRSVELAEERGLSADSLVFPENRIGHRDVLAAYGVKTYRSPKPRRWYDSSPFGTAVKFFGWSTGAVTPTLVTPEEDDYGLVNLPASLYLFDFEGRARTTADRLTEDPLVRTAKRGIDRAEADDDVFHVWFRLADLTDDRDFERLEAILDYLERTRDWTTLSVETMGSLAADVKDDEPLPREPIGPR